MKHEQSYSITIVGATGLVGQTLLKILDEENFPVSRLDLYSSKASQGKEIIFRNKKIKVKSIDEHLISNDFNFLMTNSEISKELAPMLSTKGVVIDNSTAFRLENEVPLVVPEINLESIKKNKIIANPNCTTAICSLPIFIIQKLFGLKLVIATTYQSLSGCGKNGLEILNQSRDYKELFAHDITKTCIPKIGEEVIDGYTSEELKMSNEMRKILNNYDFETVTTCVRVPIPFCHAVSLYIETQKDLNIDKLIEELSKEKEIEIANNINENIYPNSIEGYSSNKIFVGRIRRTNKKNGLALYLTSDNLRRGASYNAYKIMTGIIARDSL